MVKTVAETDTPQEFMQQAYPPQETPETPPPQTPPEEELAGYPLPGDKMKVLKVDGSALEYIVLVPKGVKTQYPMASAPKAPKPAAAPPTPPKLDIEKDSLKKENEQLRAELETLRKENEARDTEERKALATLVTDKRVEKGLLTADKKDVTVAELSKLPKEQLVILLNDTKLLEKVQPAKPLPQTRESPDQKELSEKEKKKSLMRKEMFGHDEPAEEYYKKKGGDN
jgi:hypothetical protein